MRNDDSPQIPATRHHRCLMTGLCQASHLTESKLSPQKADGLVMEKVFHSPTVQPCPVPSEPLFSDVTGTTFAIGQDVKAHAQQVPKQLPPRSKTTVECRCGPRSSRTSRSTGISIRVIPALASAVTTNKGSPR